MAAYYNEFDPFAAAWLRELIKAGVIADGEVDERSIEYVTPGDLDGFTQCHFFAGIGVWSYSLRCAGWPDDTPVWTGSCPCQPFSGAGKGAGFADERHLWPAFFHLIEIAQPPVVFGEQVASKDGLTWLDLVQTDLEGSGYACGAVDTCAAGFGAPHIRQRLYWVADGTGSGPQRGGVDGAARHGNERAASERSCQAGGVADSCQQRQHRQRVLLWENEGERREGNNFETSRCGAVGGVADSEHAGSSCSRGKSQPESAEQQSRHIDGKEVPAAPGSVNGFWRNADWLFCRDGQWRPVESGTFPLDDGDSSRVGRLRGYGNAIVAPQAQAFIEAFIEEKTAR